jgi:hypothetical protein
MSSRIEKNLSKLWELLHNREGDQPREKFFSLEMIPLGVKTCWKSEFDTLEAKQCSPQRRIVY